MDLFSCRPGLEAGSQIEPVGAAEFQLKTDSDTRYPIDSVIPQSAACGHHFLSKRDPSHGCGTALLQRQNQRAPILKANNRVGILTLIPLLLRPTIVENH